MLAVGKPERLVHLRRRDAVAVLDDLNGQKLAVAHKAPVGKLLFIDKPQRVAGLHRAHGIVGAVPDGFELLEHRIGNAERLRGVPEGLADRARDERFARCEVVGQHRDGEAARYAHHFDRAVVALVGALHKEAHVDEFAVGSDPRRHVLARLRHPEGFGFRGRADEFVGFGIVDAEARKKRHKGFARSRYNVHGTPVADAHGCAYLFGEVRCGNRRAHGLFERAVAAKIRARNERERGAAEGEPEQADTGGGAGAATCKRKPEFLREASLQPQVLSADVSEVGRDDGRCRHVVRVPARRS